MAYTLGKIVCGSLLGASYVGCGNASCELLIEMFCCSSEEYSVKVNGLEEFQFRWKNILRSRMKRPLQEFKMCGFYKVRGN